MTNWFKPIFHFFLIWLLDWTPNIHNTGKSTHGRFPSVMSQVNANDPEYSPSHNRMSNKSQKYRTYRTTVKSVVSCNFRTKGLPNTVILQMLESYKQFVSYCTPPLYRQTDRQTDKPNHLIFCFTSCPFAYCTFYSLYTIWYMYTGNLEQTQMPVINGWTNQCWVLLLMVQWNVMGSLVNFWLTEPSGSSSARYGNA